MDYTLALQLKEAGFPIKEIVGSTINIPGIYYGPLLTLPTLSELIEACGDGFDGLMSQKRIPDTKGDWVAMKSRYESLEECFFGPTPEEAVANLYLQLHERKA